MFFDIFSLTVLKFSQPSCKLGLCIGENNLKRGSLRISVNLYREIPPFFLHSERIEELNSFSMKLFISIFFYFHFSFCLSVSVFVHVICHYLKVPLL